MAESSHERDVLPSDLDPWYSNPLSVERFLAMASPMQQAEGVPTPLNLEPGIYFQLGINQFTLHLYVFHGHVLVA